MMGGYTLALVLTDISIAATFSTEHTFKSVTFFPINFLQTQNPYIHIHFSKRLLTWCLIFIVKASYYAV